MIDEINLDKFEKFLNEFLNREIDLYTIVKYQMGLVDEFGQSLDNSIPERNFALLTLMISKILSGDSDKAIPLASGIELLGNSWYVHGDVESGITHRNGKPTVWWVWGPAQAINTGDGFHALARLVIVDNSIDYGDEKILIALNTFDLAFLNLSEGENLDISYQDKPLVSLDEYLEMVKKRSGSIVGCAFQFGLLSTNLPESSKKDQLSIFDKIGFNFGILQQLKNDWTTIFESKTPDSQLFHRFSSKKKNISVLYALENENPSIKRQIGEIYLKRVLEEEDRQKIQSLLLNTGFQDFYDDLIKKNQSELNLNIDSSFMSSDKKQILKTFCKQQFSSI